MYTVDLYYPDFKYDYHVEPTKDDYIEFCWEKEKQVKFDPYTYKYHDQNGELYKKLEDDWLHNKIDEFKLIHDHDFVTYLTDKYEGRAFDCYYSEQMDIVKSLDFDASDYDYYDD